MTHDSDNALKKARINAGYHTAKDFYEKFNIKASTYFAHESGRNPLSTKIAKKYGELLNISPSQLLIDENENQDRLDKYLLNHGQVPRDSLLNKMLNDTTVQFLKSAGIQRGMKVADFGCGTGSISCWLAEFVGNLGKVYAIDKSYEQLSIIKMRANQFNINNIDYIRAEVTDKPINLKIDFAYMRCFLHHTPKPKNVIQMIVDLLPVGGSIVCIEPIMSSFWSFPETPEVKKAIEFYLKLGKKHNLDFDIGKKIYQYLFDTKMFENFQTFTYHGIAATRYEKSWIEMITSECAEKYIEAKFTTAKEMDDIIAKINRHIEQDSTIATLPQFVCITAKRR